MAAIDFPATPTNGQLFTPANGITYRYLTSPGIWAVANGPVDTVISSDTPPASPVPNQLWFNSALAMLYVFYDDGSSQQWVPSMPVPAPIAMRVKFTPFLTNGTWTPDVNCLFGHLIGKGGGSVGTAAGGYANGVVSSPGGISGMEIVKYFNKVDLAASYPVVIGPGGGGAGGDTTIGALLVAPGGGSGTTAVGDLITAWPQQAGHYINVGAAGGVSWASPGGGGGGGQGARPASGQAIAGSAANPNSGGGGGGGASLNNAGTGAGGAGGSGFAYAVEQLKG